MQAVVPYTVNMREAVPYQAPRAGDIIEAGGQLIVVQSVEEAQDGAGTILALSANGTPRRLGVAAGDPVGYAGPRGPASTARPEGFVEYVNSRGVAHVGLPAEQAQGWG
jgi:hypothetical protein